MCTAQATMVVTMSEGRVATYKEDAKADMILNNRTQIRCPCRKCKLRTWNYPDSGQLEEHLLRRGFRRDINGAPAGHGHPDEGDAGGHHHHKEGDAGGHHHHEEGDAGGHDHHEEGDDAGVDGGGEDANTQTLLTSALRDPHVQELLLKETSNTRAAAREKAKLAQMEIDGMTPLYPGCRPEDTRLNVTLKGLEMKAEHKWTDVSFNANMEF